MASRVHHIRIFKLRIGIPPIRQLTNQYQPIRQHTNQSDSIPTNQIAYQPIRQLTNQSDSIPTNQIAYQPIMFITPSVFQLYFFPFIDFLRLRLRMIYIICKVVIQHKKNDGKKGGSKILLKCRNVYRHLVEFYYLLQLCIANSIAVKQIMRLLNSRPFNVLC